MLYIPEEGGKNQQFELILDHYIEKSHSNFEICFWAKQLETALIYEAVYRKNIHHPDKEISVNIQNGGMETSLSISKRKHYIFMI